MLQLRDCRSNFDLSVKSIHVTFSAQSTTGVSVGLRCNKTMDLDRPSLLESVRSS